MSTANLPILRLLFTLVLICAPLTSVPAQSVSEEPANPSDSAAYGRFSKSPGGPPTRMSAPSFTFPALRAADDQWVSSTLAAMTLDEKVGQMIMPTWTSGSAATNLANYDVGGFIFLANTTTTILNATNSLQAASSVPLLFSVDCEAGSGARVTGGTRFPMNMASGAMDDITLAREQGVATARECRALGIHVGFGPVVDVNTEPINPIIGIRSYSDQPATIARLAKAYIEGANSGGLLCTLKHFPGHGATTGDSHESLQVVDITQTELEDVHIAPYTQLVNEGFDNLIMSAHVWYPALDPGPSARPATLSAAALTTEARTRMGFNGTIVSDAFNMSGLTVVATPEEAVRVGVQAGLDIVLMPVNVPDAFNGLKAAVINGDISETRIDQSVRRILSLKSRVGLPEAAITTPTLAASLVGHPAHNEAATSIGQKSIRSLRVQPAEFPVNAAQRVLVVTVAASSQIFYLYPNSHFTGAMTSRLPLATVRNVSSSATSGEISTVLADIPNHDRVVVAVYDWRPGLSTNKTSLINQIAAAGKPVALVSFGSAYHIQQFPQINNYYCAFSSHDSSQIEAARILTGETTQTQFNWPVELNANDARISRWPNYDPGHESH